MTLPSVLDLAMLWWLASANAVSVPSASDPGPSPRCPSDMRLVVGRHFEEVEHLCTEWRKSANRCFAYYPLFTIGHGSPDRVETCMDRFEAPNIEGEKPIVMKTLPEAEAFCASKQKRVCSETEWETACESGDEKPWQYGWRVDRSVCNSDKAWRPVDERALGQGGEVAQREVDKLWQGAPSGSRAACVTKDGIFDMMGNVEEWVTSSRPRKFRGALMGGFWAKPWTGCRGTNDAHEPNFRFYEVGFRCCTEPKEEAGTANGAATTIPDDGGAP